AVFEDMAAVFTFRVIVPREDGSAEQLHKAQVTTNFFRMLGARIAFGRDFTLADGQRQPVQSEAALPVGSTAILSHEYWQRRYGGDTAVLGKEMLSSSQRGPRIVGVLEPGFELFFPPGASVIAKPDVWIANNLGYERGPAGLRVVGKMRRGVGLDRAQAEADKVAAGLRENVPWFADGGMRIRLEPMRKHLVEAVRPALLTLMVAVIFLMLIACAN
ncbi:MAG: hypothetical protein GY953_37860, partial [bacterium]|nr:hypothetical protein [bacterium]